MKKYLAILLLGLYSLVSAQTVQTTPNLLTSGTNHTWYGVTTGAVASDYMGGTSAPRYDPSTNTVYFSYGSASIGQTMAVNQALANVGAGVKINGYTYSYDVRNMNGDDRQPGVDAFTVSQLLRGPSNSVLLSSNQYHNTKFEWKTVTGSKTATTPYNIADTTYIQFGVQGVDSGYWGGYFGPQIRNVDMRLTYSVDPCTTNPAYSPSCANYNTVSTQSLFSGVTGPQAYAINQALSGSGVMVHGFDYGYNYSVGNRFCNFLDIFGGCLGTWIYPSASVTTTVTDNADTAIFTETNTHAAGAVGAYNKAMRFGASRPISTIGSFSMTPTTNHGAQITNMYGSVVYTADPCVTDPLSNPSCPGYASAYLTQQCTISALYNSACPGYATALFTQQCNSNQLSNQSCPGYAAAYLVQQCTTNPLYSTTCAGYETAYFNQQCTADPLYNSSCAGYSTAYHTQQCTANPLYATDCSGYDAAYLLQQCSANPLYSTQCSGYAAAYKTQQCTANPLYATDCPGYAVAYKAQQCTANALYATDCPGYAEAYFSQQCTANGLYNNQCPNYSEAYAKKMLLEKPVTTSTVTTTNVSTTEPITDLSGAVTVAMIADPIVNNAITTTATSASPAQAATATVPLAPPPAASTAPEPKKEVAAKTPDSSTPSSGPSDGSKPSDSPKSNREALQDRRREAAQKDAVAKGANLANEMGKAADLEAQKAVQNVVIAAMGFTPGFDTYNKSTIPDANIFYKPFTVYGGQVNVDNKNINRRLMGGSDFIHNTMVESQYKLGDK